jgi:hypothetical protein
MRSSTLLALFVCVLFVSSGLRTAFGQDEVQGEEEKHVASKSDEGSGEASSGSQEQSGNLPAVSGEQEVSGKLQDASGEQEVSGKLQADGNIEAAPGEQEEVSGKLQADPDTHSRTELLDSAEVGEVDADKKDSDVENIPEHPETEQLPDTARSGNLDTSFGKRSFYTVAVKNCVCRSRSGKCSALVENIMRLMGRKIWGTFPDSANKASFV